MRLLAARETWEAHPEDLVARPVSCARHDGGCDWGRDSGTMWMGVLLDVASAAKIRFVIAWVGRSCGTLKLKELWLQAVVKQAKVKLHDIAAGSHPAYISSLSTGIRCSFVV